MKIKFFTLLFLILFISCSSGTNPSNSTPGSTSLASVSSWAYQLQDINLDEIGNSEFDLVVVDYSADGSDEEAFSEDEIQTMRGDDGKLILSYLSIGEAEDYRYYFDASAEYVDAENPDWPGNYKVFYWDEEWQEIMEGYIDKLIAAGFDGMYLDIIDAYEYYGPDGESGLDRDTAADDMVDFVVRLANYARAQDEDFIVIVQNGSDIINEATNPEDYFDVIDGIGAEDTFYFGDEDNDNDLDEQDSVIENLNEFLFEEKIVLSVDYLTDADKIDDFYDRAEAETYLPYATVRDLDQLTINEGHEPD